MIFRFKKSMDNGVDNTVADHPFWALSQLVVQSRIITDPCEHQTARSKPCRGHVIWNDPKIIRCEQSSVDVSFRQ